MMFKVMLIRDAIKYGTYALIGFLLILFVIFMGNPSPNPSSSAGALSCRPTGKTITVDELNKRLKGKGVFEGKAEAFIVAGQRYGIDPVLVAAIALHETGQGKSNMVRTKNNPGGLYYAGSFMSFPSLDAGIDKMAQNLTENYISKGLKTPEQIGPKYAPVGAKNDPTGLNRYWIPSVTKYVNELGGLSYDCSAQDVGNLGPISPSGFLRPLDKSHIITSPYGFRWRNTEFHPGIDIGCKKGEPIVAAKSGKVIASMFGYPGSGYGGYGNAIEIDHGGGVHTLYGHMSQRIAQKGQYVSQGQVIGLCGTTGKSTGYHLHFEVRVNGNRVNPTTFVQ